MSDDRYARVKFSIMDDPKFDGIREKPELLGSWTLCLLVAEMAWPSSAFVPPWVPRTAFQRLVAAGLVDPMPNGSYRVHGLDAERSKRSDQARTASNARWNAGGNAPSIADAFEDRMPSRAEQRTEEQSTRRADLDAFLAVRFRVPTQAQRALMDTYCRVFDVTGPDRAAQLIYAHPDDPIGALKADLEAFRSERRRDAEGQERPVARRSRRGTGMSSFNAELARILADGYAKQERHAAGDHSEPVDGCPSCRPESAS